MEVGTALGVAGVVISVPALADACVAYAYRLHDKIHKYRDAEALFKVQREEHHLYTKQVAISLVFVKDLSPFLSNDLNEVIRTAIDRLSKAFEDSLNLMERAFDEEGKVRRLWFVMHGKSALEKSMRNVNKCHDIFLRCLHYSVLLGGSNAAQCLTNVRAQTSPALGLTFCLQEAVMSRIKDSPMPAKLVLDNQDLPPGPRFRLHSQSEVRIVKSDFPDVGSCLVEYRPYTPADNKSLRRIRDIASILHNTDTTMAILPCRGFHCQPTSSRCELVFPFPPGMEKPRTLRDLLSAPENAYGVRHSLTSRLDVALRLAKAVLYVHTAKLVHKNIRPENIVLFERQDSPPQSKFPYSLGTLFLMGFDFARKEDEASSRTGDSEWDRNLYRHPERQGLHHEVDFNMLHDIYSLGVVLLEIALWKPFVLEKVEGGMTKSIPNAQSCKIVDKATRRLKPPEEIRSAFVKRAEEAIPLVLGEKYKDVVIMCLNALNGGFGETADLLDDDGVIVGLAYVQKVLSLLDDISI
jgi:serine/threonine protein kinase